MKKYWHRTILLIAIVLSVDLQGQVLENSEIPEEDRIIRLTHDSGTQVYEIYRIYPDRVIVSHENRIRVEFTKNQVKKVTNHKVDNLILQSQKLVTEIPGISLEQFRYKVQEMENLLLALETAVHTYSWLIPEASMEWKNLSVVFQTARGNQQIVDQALEPLSTLQKTLLAGQPLSSTWENIFQNSINIAQSITFDRLKTDLIAKIQNEANRLKEETKVSTATNVPLIEEKLNSINELLKNGTITYEMWNESLSKAESLVKKIYDPQVRRSLDDKILKVREQTWDEVQKIENNRIIHSASTTVSTANEVLQKGLSISDSLLNQVRKVLELLENLPESNEKKFWIDELTRTMSELDSKRIAESSKKSTPEDDGSHSGIALLAKKIAQITGITPTRQLIGIMMLILCGGGLVVVYKLRRRLGTKILSKDQPSVPHPEPVKDLLKQHKTTTKQPKGSPKEPILPTVSTLMPATSEPTLESGISARAEQQPEAASEFLPLSESQYFAQESMSATDSYSVPDEIPQPEIGFPPNELEFDSSTWQDQTTEEPQFPQPLDAVSEEMVNPPSDNVPNLEVVEHEPISIIDEQFKYEELPLEPVRYETFYDIPHTVETVFVHPRYPEEPTLPDEIRNNLEMGQYFEDVIPLLAIETDSLYLFGMTPGKEIWISIYAPQDSLNSAPQIHPINTQVLDCHVQKRKVFIQTEDKVWIWDRDRQLMSHVESAVSSYPSSDIFKRYYNQPVVIGDYQAIIQTNVISCWNLQQSSPQGSPKLDWKYSVSVGDDPICSNLEIIPQGVCYIRESGLFEVINPETGLVHYSKSLSSPFMFPDYRTPLLALRQGLCTLSHTGDQCQIEVHNWNLDGNLSSVPIQDYKRVILEQAIDNLMLISDGDISIFQLPDLQIRWSYSFEEKKVIDFAWDEFRISLLLGSPDDRISLLVLGMNSGIDLWEINQEELRMRSVQSVVMNQGSILLWGTDLDNNAVLRSVE